ncbi:MAG: PAS domain S-box protein, partial [Syntrophaceae bacterium]|nr:PAS domain S-box protein [Syntrophaceae bacterium]
IDPMSVPDTYEFQLVDRKKQVKDILVTITPIPESKQILTTLLDIGEHRRMEKALTESKRRLADLIDFLPDATYAIDHSGKIIAWNRAIEEMSGTKAEDMLGKGEYEYAMPFYGIRRPALVDMALEYDEEIEKKYDFVKREGNMLVAEGEVTVRGKSFALWGKAAPFYDRHGNIIGAIESLRDITVLKQAEKVLRKAHDELEIRVRERTSELMEANKLLQAEIIERKQAEAALIESERHLADIINFLPDPTYVIDLSGKVIAWNHAIEEMTGVKAEDMLGTEDHKYIIPFYGTPRPVLIDLVFNPNEELEKKYDFVKREGDILLAEAEVPVKGVPHILWGKAAPLYDSHGSIIGAIESVRDITEFKQAQKALQKAHDELEIRVAERTAELVKINDALQKEILERKKTEAILKDSEKKFAATFYKSAIPMAITAIKDGRYIDVNESFMKVMGLKYEELVGDSSTGAGYITAESRALFLNEYRQKGFVENLELSMRVKNGKRRRGLFNSSKITIGSEEFFLTMVTDITELRRVEEKLKKYRDELESMVAERTSELEDKTNNLQKVNTTLNVLLQKREEDRKILEENFVANISSLILPYIGGIRRNNLDAQQQLCLDTIEKNLGDIVSPLLKNMQQFDLTPREVQIASLIKDGKTTKEIARALGIGEGSIDTHRKNIRKKIGLDRASNLQSHLRFLEK